MIVIIDNYDSFTYNLVQYYYQLTNEVHVYQNDQTTISQIQELKPDLIVLSPGPGNPSDSGISQQVVAQLHQQFPILGVCLGFQVIVDFFGGNVIRGVQPMHGKTSKVEHDQEGVFHSVPTPTTVTRYHSLIASDRNFPNDHLKITARSLDGAIMGIRHPIYPIEGIQFHPESILTNKGFEMIKNSYLNAIQWKTKRGESKHESLPSI